MGLLEKIESGTIKKSQGLYEKAKAYEGMVPDFIHWAQSKHLCQAGIIKFINSHAIISHGIGLDAQTVISSFSETSFWNENLPIVGKWKSLVGEQELAEFYQLFSDEIVITLKSLHLLKLDENNLLFVCERANDDFILPEEESIIHILLNIIYKPEIPFTCPESQFEKGIGISPSNLFILSTNLATDAYISKLTAEEAIKNTASKAIESFIFNKIQILFSEPHFTRNCEKGEIKISVYSREEIDEKLLQFHIQSNLTSILAEQSQQVVLLFAGMCPNTKGTLAFFLYG